ncbi:MAG: hypothetical protein EXQ93_01415 [Alphaproteobacteria bacterium]|nr:hypothetical protein [Alphaproteobacteria bacterium]
MAWLAESSSSAPHNPVDALEQLVSANEWPFERIGEDEIAFGVGGSHVQYQLWFGWHEGAGALEFRCAFDLGVPDRRYAEICEVMARVNEQLWIGHFEATPTESQITFRHTMLLGSGSPAAHPKLETLVEVALAACERCYPAFMLLLWGGKKPEDAVAAAMLETVGEA